MTNLTTMLRGEMLRLADAHGRLIRVQAGRLWITQDGEGTDHIVEAGQTFTIGKPGVTLITALRPSALQHLGEAVSLPLQLAAAWLEPFRELVRP